VHTKLLMQAAVHRLRAAMAMRRFALGVATGGAIAALLLAVSMAWSPPTAHSDIHVAESTTGGEAIDTLVVTDHLYLHGPGGTLFELSISKDASGKPMVTATPAGG
jgi:hypothetical protein